MDQVVMWYALWHAAARTARFQLVGADKVTSGAYKGRDVAQEGDTSC